MQYAIYEKKEIKARPSRKKVVLDSYIVGGNAPVALICPGGAYTFVSDSNEGKPIAEAFHAHGYNAFVLTYSVGGAARFPAPLEDLARAIQFIRAHAKEWEIDAEKLVLVGSSAGGHLCAFFSAIHSRFENDYHGEEISVQPQALILAYPVITMGDLTHKVSRRRLLGFLSGGTEQRAASVQRLVTESYPPTFLWHCKDDQTVNYQNSTMLKEELDNCGVPSQLELYEHGGHGIGLADGTDAAGWFDKAFAFTDKIFRGE